MGAAENLAEVLDRIESVQKNRDLEANNAQLIAVSKTYDGGAIRPTLDAGHRVFGENRVQEAQGKWPELQNEYDNIELHLIGPLQSNKSKEAVALFDVIQTVDREKIAKALSQEIASQSRDIKLYVQVNTGEEPQKAGISPMQAVDFVNRCREEYGLNIVGLMCIPPLEENPGPHFALLRKLARESGVKKLSMGMSGDFEVALEFGATAVRVGSAIFGERG